MARYRIRIDRESCIGDKQCGQEAPNTFYVDDEGVALVTDPDGDPPEYILQAAQKCLQKAIALYDPSTGKQISVDAEADAAMSWCGCERSDLAHKPRGLWISIRELQALLDDPPSPSEAVRGQDWRGDVTRLLRILRDQLGLYFGHEQRLGLFQELTLEFPRASVQFEVLQSEHQEILSELDGIVAGVDDGPTAPAAPVDDHCARARRLLGRFARHEAAENDLIRHLYSDDLGISG